MIAYVIKKGRVPVWGAALFIVVLILNGCKKTDSQDMEYRCLPLPDAPPLGWTDSFVGLQVRAPQINPADENEFVIIIPPINTSGGLYKYNAATGAKTLLLAYKPDLYPISQPSFGKNGWILLGMSDYRIYKIKSNGDSLSLVTPRGSNYVFPLWNPSCDRIVVDVVDDTCELWDANGNFLKLLPHFGRAGTGAFFDDDRIIARDYTDIGLYSIAQDRFESYALIPDDASVASSTRLGPKQFCWSTRSGIYRTDLDTKQTVKLRESCTSRLYTSASARKDGSEMFWRRDLVEIQNGKRVITTELVRTDADGRSERVLPVVE